MAEGVSKWCRRAGGSDFQRAFLCMVLWLPFGSAWPLIATRTALRWNGSKQGYAPLCREGSVVPRSVSKAIVLVTRVVPFRLQSSEPCGAIDHCPPYLSTSCFKLLFD